MKKLAAKVTISKVTSNREPDYIQIEIVDQKSACQAVVVKMTPHYFGLAVTGLGYQPAEMEFNSSGVIGKNYEHKTEAITVPCSAYADEEERVKLARVAVKPFEKDGWKADLNDMRSRYKATERNEDSSVWTISFRRYVEDPPAEK